MKNLMPETVSLKFGDGVKRVPAKEVRVGERIIVEPGERVPLDGIVIKGESSVNTFAITGGVAATPIRKGSLVFAGYTNLDETIIVESRETVSRSTMSRIMDWVSSGKNESNMEKLTRGLAFFLPIGMIPAAALLYFIPILFKWDSMALQKGAASLIAIAFPGALTQTIPKLFKAGAAKAANSGVLFRDATAIEQLAGITSAYIEHNGALTKGEFRVIRVESEGLPELALLRLAASAVNNPHCVMPMHKYALAERYTGKIDSSVADETRSMHGGIVVEIKGNTVAVGNSELMFEENIRIENGTDTGEVLYVAVNGKYAGRIIFANAVRPDAAETVYRLQSSDVKAVLFSDEAADDAKETARSMGFDKLYNDVSRNTKKKLLSGLNTAYIGFEEDLLACAEVGITMAEPGPELIKKSVASMPSVTVFSESLLRITDAHHLARSVRDIARADFTAVFSVKAALVLLALIGFCPFWLAVTAETIAKYFCGSRKI
jgi:Cd2+/Zn2+-exporting ATPase